MNHRFHVAAEAFIEVSQEGTLDAGEILPGFTLSLREWLQESE